MWFSFSPAHGVFSLGMLLVFYIALVCFLKSCLFLDFTSHYKHVVILQLQHADNPKDVTYNVEITIILLQKSIMRPGKTQKYWPQIFSENNVIFVMNKTKHMNTWNLHCNHAQLRNIFWHTKLHLVADVIIKRMKTIQASIILNGYYAHKIFTWKYLKNLGRVTILHNQF